MTIEGGISDKVAGDEELAVESKRVSVKWVNVAAKHPHEPQSPSDYLTPLSFDPNPASDRL